MDLDGVPELPSSIIVTDFFIAGLGFANTTPVTSIRSTNRTDVLLHRHHQSSVSNYLLVWHIGFWWLFWVCVFLGTGAENGMSPLLFSHSMLRIKLYIHS